MKKKTIKRILTLAVAAAALATLPGTSVFAANTVITNGTWIGSDAAGEDAGTAVRTNHLITVTNVQDTATNLDVTAYQIVKGTYKDGKLTGYVVCNPAEVSIEDIEAPKAAEITAIADKIRANTTTLRGIKMTKGTGNNSNKYTATVEAGLYIVLATGADAYVYNPAIVAVNIDDANDIDDEGEGNDGLTKPIGDPAAQVDYTSVDLASYWDIPSQAFLKSSTTSFNKDIVASPTNVTPEDSEGDIVAKGDQVYFKLDQMTIPSYSDEYAKPDGENELGVVYRIDDKLDGNSFAGINTLTVKTVVGNARTEVPASYVDDKGTPETDDDVNVTNFTVVYKNSEGTVVTGDDIASSAVSYSIRFTDAWIRANAEKGLEITYSSYLTENAYVNGKANKSAATLSYTVNPSDNTGVEVLRDSTYHYTFEIGGLIDANVDGNTGGTIDGDGSIHGYEIDKVTSVLEQGEEYTADGTTGEFSSQYALEGAEFTLYDDAGFSTIHQMKSRNATTGVWETSDAVYTTTSDGHIVFSGLDTGTYYLKETNAPEGYTLNEHDYKVVIEGTISDGTDEEEGTLTGYSITTYVKDGNNWTQQGSAVYAITPAVTKPSTDAESLNLDTVVNTIITTVTPAEVVDTQLAVLPATGGVGTIIITVTAAAGMTLFLTIYLVNRKKRKNEKMDNETDK